MLLDPSLTVTISHAFSVSSPRVTSLPAALARECRELAAMASEPTMFYEGWFLGPSLLHLRSDQHIYLAEVRSAEGILIGLMPLCINSKYGRTPAKHVRNWMHYQCFLGAPLVKAGAEVAFWQALIVHLDQVEWARGFLSVAGLVEHGPIHTALIEAARSLNRSSPVVHRYERAMLASQSSPEAYLETNIRAKKRKELRRLSHRLAERGALTFSTLTCESEIEQWAREFLALESAGWKGERGSALGNTPPTSRFFHDIISGAFAEGKLDFQRLSLDDKAVAMLVNFKTPPGSWSFKIAYDEDLARFSPGVLIELENVPRILNDPEIDWMDSCAVKDHPMINSLWGERRAIIQVSVPLVGLVRNLTYLACRTAERGSAWIRTLRTKHDD